MLIDHLHIFFFEANVQNICLFLIWLLDVLFCIWESSWYILEKLLLLKINCGYFPVMYGLIFFFISLMALFEENSQFWWSLIYKIYKILVLCVLRNLFLHQSSKDFLMSLSIHFIVLISVFRPVNHWVNFYFYWEVKTECSSFLL